MAWMLLAVAISGSAWGRTPDGDDEKKDGAKPATGSTTQAETLSAELKAQRAELEAQRALIESLRARKPEAPGMSLVGGTNPPAAQGDLDFKVSFTDGFHLKSGEDFDLHVGGRVEIDYREILNRPILPNQTGALAKEFPNTFFFRELFLSLDGTLYKDWGFKLNEDFSAQGANSTTPAGSPATGVGGSTGTIPENSWLEWKHFREFRIQAGEFKSPNEAETLASPLFTEFVSRSLMSRFVENQDLGVNVYGDIGEGLFTYQIAWQDGRGILSNGGRALVDDNDGKEWGARFTVAPFVQENGSFLSGLRAGVWGSYGREGQGGIRGNTEVYSASGFQSTEFNVAYLEFPSGAGVQNYVLLGRRIREGGELTYAVGPFEFRGELMQRRDEFLMTAGPRTREDHLLAIRTYYAQVTYVVTGEEKIPDARISPRRNFDPTAGGWGALELGVRYSAVGIDRNRLNDISPAGNILTSPTGNSNHVSSLTLGANWWLTKNVRLAFNWIHEHYAEGVTFTDTSPSGSTRRVNLGGFLTQLQIDF
jgi:phosphate-selective porin